MPDLTTRGELPYPLGDDPPDTDGVVRALAQAVASRAAFRLPPAPAAQRPAASAALEGYLFTATDTGAVDYCTGTAWLPLVQTSVPLDYAEAADLSSSAPGDTASAGTTGEVADGGHRHAREPWGRAQDVAASNPGDAAAAGTTGRVADAGHVHPREARSGYARLFLSTGV